MVGKVPCRPDLAVCTPILVKNWLKHMAPRAVTLLAPSQIFVHTYDKVIVTPLNKSSKNMVNSAEPGFKSAKNDLFVLTHCDFLKCTFQG